MKKISQQEWWNSLQFHHAGSYSRICDRCGDTFYGEEAPHHFEKLCIELCTETGSSEPQSAMKAWFDFNDKCEKVGMVASAYTAFISGYRAGQFDCEELKEKQNDCTTTSN